MQESKLIQIPPMSTNELRNYVYEFTQQMSVTFDNASLLDALEPLVVVIVESTTEGKESGHIKDLVGYLGLDLGQEISLGRMAKDYRAWNKDHIKSNKDKQKKEKKKIGLDFIESRCTEVSNSCAFIQKFQGQVLWTQEAGWCEWNGKFWQTHSDAKMINRAIEVCKDLYKEALKLGGDESEALQKHAIASQSNRALKAMLDIARGAVGASIVEFDPDSMLLNCRNGILDLRTGKLLEHSPKFLCSKVANVDFDPGATCPRWESFIQEIFDIEESSDAEKLEMQSYLQRIFGYSLTGLVSEQCLFFLFGSGANGKSVLLETLGELMGTYAVTTPARTFAWQPGNSSASNDVARLAGRRVCITSEIDDGMRWNEGLIKDVTSGDKQVARFLHQEFFEFSPQLKVFIRGNSQPKVRGIDEGIWRRFKLVPFERQFGEQERQRDLLEVLRQELPGVLNWALGGLLRGYLEVGLKAPTSCRAALAEYRTDNDPLERFLLEYNYKETENKSEFVKGTELYSEYVTWLQDANTKVDDIPDSRKFGRDLMKKRFKRIKKRSGVYYSLTNNSLNLDDIN